MLGSGTELPYWDWGSGLWTVNDGGYFSSIFLIYLDLPIDYPFLLLVNLDWTLDSLFLHHLYLHLHRHKSSCPRVSRVASLAPSTHPFPVLTSLPSCITTRVGQPLHHPCARRDKLSLREGKDRHPYSSPCPPTTKHQGYALAKANMHRPGQLRAGSSSNCTGLVVPFPFIAFDLSHHSCAANSDLSVP